MRNPGPFHRLKHVRGRPSMLVANSKRSKFFSAHAFSLLACSYRPTPGCASTAAAGTGGSRQAPSAEPSGRSGSGL